MNRPAVAAASPLLALLLLCACGGGGRADSEAARPEGPVADETPAARWTEERARSEVGAVAAEVLDALGQRDVLAVAALVHTARGVRLSPYAFVAPDEHVRLTPPELVAAWSDPEPRVWGYDDATGEAIELTLPEYLERFIYDGDFSEAAVVGYNTRIGQGNTVDNAAEVYPDGVTVEYHLPGSEDYGGMDWRSLRLVLAPDEQQDGAWRLVAVIHDQWTP